MHTNTLSTRTHQAHQVHQVHKANLSTLSTRMHALSTKSARMCVCVGRFAPELTPKDFDDSMRCFSNIAKYHQFEWLAETVRWIREGARCSHAHRQRTRTDNARAYTHTRTHTRTHAYDGCTSVPRTMHNANHAHTHAHNTAGRQKAAPWPDYEVLSAPISAPRCLISPAN